MIPSLQAVAEATSLVRALLTEERAHLESGEVEALLALAPRKREALEAWRRLIEQLDEESVTEAVAVELGHQALEIRTYAEETLARIVELVAQRSQRRGAC